MQPTADLFDAHEQSTQTCSVLFRDYGGRAEFFGPIRTVRCLNDNVLFRELLGAQGNGAVIVVDGQGSTERALMGDMLAARAFDNGWAGVIIHGVIRDSAEIGNIDIGVKALGTNPAKSEKRGDGAVDEPVTFGGVTFVPGQWIYCDTDGILVSPNELVS